MAGKPKDLTGQRFNRLVAIRLHHRDAKRNPFWLCRCDCGNTPIVAGSMLKRGIWVPNTETAKTFGTKSCGCLRRERWASNTGTPKPGTAMRRIFSRYRLHARHRNIPWQLSEDTFRRVTSSPCFYTGRPPAYVSTADSGEVYLYNGIDRLDNSCGYTVENCVPCCGVVNMMKKSMPYSEFLQLCKEIAAHSEVLCASSRDDAL